MEFRNQLLFALAPPDLEALLPSLSEATLERGQVVFEPGDEVSQVLFPGSAVLSIVTMMLSGDAVESSTVGYESATPLLAALADQPSKARIFAQIGGSALKLPSKVLRTRASESPSLMRLLLRHAGSIAFQSEQGVACNVLHDATSRLARWLLMTQDRTGGRILPLTQDYMAIMTGVQRTTISAVANTLRSAGLIKFSRGNLEIVDRPGLEARACECYRAVADEIQALRAG